MLFVLYSIFYIWDSEVVYIMMDMVPFSHYVTFSILRGGVSNSNF